MFPFLFYTLFSIFQEVKNMWEVRFIDRIDLAKFRSQCISAQHLCYRAWGRFVGASPKLERFLISNFVWWRLFWFQKIQNLSLHDFCISKIKSNKQTNKILTNERRRVSKVNYHWFLVNISSMYWLYQLWWWFAGSITWSRF